MEETHPCVKVLCTSLECLAVRCVGNSEGKRNGFLDAISSELIVFLGYERGHMQKKGTGGIKKEDLGFWYFVREIAKNMWDHADGKGSFHFIRDELDVRFWICDQGREGFSLATIKKGGSSKAGNGTNFGAGVIGGMIDDWSREAGLSYTLNPERGFEYTGTF